MLLVQRRARHRNRLVLALLRLRRRPLPTHRLTLCVLLSPLLLFELPLSDSFLLPSLISELPLFFCPPLLLKVPLVLLLLLLLLLILVLLLLLVLLLVLMLLLLLLLLQLPLPLLLFEQVLLTLLLEYLPLLLFLLVPLPLLLLFLAKPQLLLLASVLLLLQKATSPLDLLLNPSLLSLVFVAPDVLRLLDLVQLLGPLLLQLPEALLFVLGLLETFFFVESLPQLGFLDLLPAALFLVAALARVLRLERWWRVVGRRLLRLLGLRVEVGLLDRGSAGSARVREGHVGC